MFESRFKFIVIIVFIMTISITGGIVSAQEQICDLTSAEAFSTRGDDSYNAGDYESALQDYTCALELDPNDAAIYVNRGNTFWGLENYDSAIADYNRSIELNYSDLYIPYYNRGSVYLILEEVEKAEEDFNTSLTYNPEYPEAYNNRGTIYYDQGDYERAIEDFTHSIEYRNYELNIPYFNRGIAYYELGDYAQSIADLTSALQIKPDDKDAVLSRAGTYESNGDEALASADYARWMELIETSTVEVTLNDAAPEQTFDMTEGTVYEVFFRAQAGQTVSIAARAEEDTEVDPLMVLLDVNDEPIASDDDSGINLDAVISQFKVSEDGIYTILLSHAGGGSEGEVTLALNVGGESTSEFTVFKLAVNEQAVVFTTSGDKLNLRSGPGLDFEILERLQRDSIVTVLEGPRKENGYAWWRIRTASGAEGWSVERVGTEQTLQLALTVDGQAMIVSAGDQLNIRAEAGRSAELVAQLSNGTLVDVLEGPVVADDLNWWKIRTDDGIEGWAVERIGDERLLVGLLDE